MASIAFDNMFEVVAADPREAMELESQAKMLITLRDTIDSHGWSSKQAAERLGNSRRQVEWMLAGKITEFDADFLVRVMSRVGNISDGREN